MNKFSKEIVTSLVVLIILVLALLALNFLGVQPDSEDGEGKVSEETSALFQSELIERALADGPHPIEGFAAPMLLEEFPGLEESDFDGVLTGTGGGEGRHLYTEGELRWERVESQPVTSAERTISKMGYQRLLANLSERLEMPATNAEEVMAIIDEIEGEVERRTINLYYYDSEKDTDDEGNIMCSDAGLVAVEREIPVTRTPIQDAVRLLIEGDLTEEERAEGLTTEFPLEGFELLGASLEDSVLALEFSDPNNRTSGGSCRAGILWFQIRETAKQFDEVEEVKFMPEELFQP